MANRNHADIQYLNLLRKIIIYNTKEEYKYLRQLVEDGELSIKEAYNILTNNNEIDLRLVLGDRCNDRTCTGTYKIFGHMMRFNLEDGFPLLTTKKIVPRLPLGELFWIISGSSNIEPLVKDNIHIWNEWPYRHYKNSKQYEIEPLTQDEFIERVRTDHEFALKWGNLGPVYGAQWRNFGGHDIFKNTIEEKLKTDFAFNIEFNKLNDIYNLGWNGAKGVDQLQNTINKLKNNPEDRRNLIFAYNPQEVNQQLLPSCLAMYQFFVKDNKLSTICYIRSQDVFLGAPFDIASGAALTHMLAQVTDYIPGEYIHISGDTHIYCDHVEQVQEQLSREPYELPTIELDKNIKNIEQFNRENVKILNYRSHPAIKAKVSV